MKRNFFLLLAAAAALQCCSVRLLAAGKTLRFSGYDWDVRAQGKSGPGPNVWDDSNVWVDPKGRLHLKITNVGGEWRCAELQTTKRFGFGRYQFEVTGRTDILDPNIVLGLFTYPAGDVGKDGTNEIDIEFAQWGHKTADNLNYTVYPSAGSRDQAKDHATYRYALEGLETTHRFEWTGRHVNYQSLVGHHGSKDALAANKQEIARWDYEPTDARLIPQQPTPIHLNLWLFQGRVPSNNKEVEIIIDRFTFEKL